MINSFPTKAAHKALNVPILEKGQTTIDMSIRVTEVFTQVSHIHMAGKGFLGDFSVMLI
jgi:hypothetical protein